MKILVGAFILSLLCLTNAESGQREGLLRQISDGAYFSSYVVLVGGHEHPNKVISNADEAAQIIKGTEP